MNRRDILKAATAGLLTAAHINSYAGTKTCQGTPAQTEGPFYPIHQQSDKDLDLTQLTGHKKTARGKIIVIEGLLQDTNCKPLSNAKVEIWQANKWGRYQHKNDPNKAPLDPDFQGWGITTTDAEGKFQFKTIMPGAYPATANWVRPPHIHFKIFHKHHKTLTTQMYFAGQALNHKDQILLALSKKEQQSVIAKDIKTPSETVPRYWFEPVIG